VLPDVKHQRCSAARAAPAGSLSCVRTQVLHLQFLLKFRLLPTASRGPQRDAVGQHRAVGSVASNNLQLLVPEAIAIIAAEMGSMETDGEPHGNGLWRMMPSCVLSRVLRLQRGIDIAAMLLTCKDWYEATRAGVTALAPKSVKVGPWASTGFALHNTGNCMVLAQHNSLQPGVLMNSFPIHACTCSCAGQVAQSSGSLMHAATCPTHTHIHAFPTCMHTFLDSSRFRRCTASPAAPA
jgi:hypothetical protein